MYLALCFPLADAFLFRLVPAAYSAAVSDFIAFSGKYRSPVSDDFLPLLVLHFCFVQFLSDFCDFFNLAMTNCGILLLWLCIHGPVSVLYVLTTVLPYLLLCQPLYAQKDAYALRVLCNYPLRLLGIYFSWALPKVGFSLNLLLNRSHAGKNISSMQRTIASSS